MTVLARLDKIGTCNLLEMAIFHGASIWVLIAYSVVQTRLNDTSNTQYNKNVKRSRILRYYMSTSVLK